MHTLRFHMILMHAQQNPLPSSNYKDRDNEEDKKGEKKCTFDKDTLVNVYHCLINHNIIRKNPSI